MKLSPMCFAPTHCNHGHSDVLACGQCLLDTLNQFAVATKVDMTPYQHVRETAELAVAVELRNKTKN